MPADATLERIATALEQIALILTAMDMRQEFKPQPAPQPVPVPAAQPAQPTFAPIGWTCPVHRQVKVVPAGVTHKACQLGRECPGSQPTCKPYESFTACPENGCREKPGRTAQVPQRAIPPSQGQQLP